MSDPIDLSGFVATWAADPGSGYTVAPAIGMPATSVVMPADLQDMGQMQPYSPAGDQMPWWQGVMLYGLTRAVDNLSRTTVAGNTDPGSFAGQSGKTYSQVPSGQGGGATRTPSASTSSTVTAKVTGSPMMLLAAAVVVYLLVK